MPPDTRPMPGDVAVLVATPIAALRSPSRSDGGLLLTGLGAGGLYATAVEHGSDNALSPHHLRRLAPLGDGSLVGCRAIGHGPRA